MSRFSSLGGEELRRRHTRAEKRLEREVVRVRATDPEFKAALDEALDLEEEIERRKNR